MDHQKLEQVAKNLTAPGKGVLAADESENSCKKRFDVVGVECTEETRKEYRGLLFTTPDVEKYLSGVIFFDETFWQSNEQDPFRTYLGNRGVSPGIKVDKGLIDLPGFQNEKLTQGLDGLPEKLTNYAGNDAKFAKWRSVITIGDGIPTDECIGANTFVLARYARICQDAGIVPVVEPEILYDGHHTIEQCEQVMAHTFDLLFQTMRAFRVHLPGAVLKTSMILPGKDSGVEMDNDAVAERTSRILKEHVPKELGGVLFLSGGQTSNQAFINLNRIAKKGPYPWGLTFSYSRALQDPVLKAWASDRQNRESTQALFQKQLERAVLASKGELDESQLDQDHSASQAQDL
jgi:fructose-bisphosphate aldolase class I